MQQGTTETCLEDLFVVEATALLVESLVPRARHSKGTSSAAHGGEHDRSSHVEGRGRDRRGEFF